MTEQKRESLIIIVSAPSGSGKTTIVERVTEEMQQIDRSISLTTREPRPEEENGIDYIFVTKEEFNERKDKGEFLECEEVFGNFYGTSANQVKKAVEDGHDIILSIDVKGARSVKEKYPECISVFIMPPTAEELASRLKKRNTDGENQVAMRLKESQKEIEASEEYDYMIINEELDEAIEELKEIIKVERKNRKTGEEK